MFVVLIWLGKFHSWLYSFACFNFVMQPQLAIGSTLLLHRELTSSSQKQEKNLMYVQNKTTNRFWNIKQHNYLLLNTVTSFTPSNSVSNLCCLQGESSQKCCWVCSCGLLKALHIIKCEEESDVRSSKFNSYPFTNPHIHTHKKKWKNFPSPPVVSLKSTKQFQSVTLAF